MRERSERSSALTRLRMLGIDRERQAVEEAPALRWRAGEQRIHRRHQPDHAQVIGEGRGRSRPARGRSGICAAIVAPSSERPLDAGAERGKPERALDFGGDRPGAVAFAERDLVERGAAQAAARREERNRLDQIGLAGAVRPDQHDGVRVGFKRRRVIVAEIGQREATDHCRIIRYRVIEYQEFGHDA